MNKFAPKRAFNIETKYLFSVAAVSAINSVTEFSFVAVIESYNCFPLHREENVQWARLFCIYMHFLSKL